MNKLLPVRAVPVLALLLVLATAVAAPQALGSRTAQIRSVAAQVPASYKSKGTLTVAADATYAPNEFIGSNGKTVVGMDADLAKALGDRHGPQGRRS